MNPPTKLTALELAELCRIPHLLTLLEECLEGEAWDTFLSIKTGKYQSVKFTNNDPRWIYYTPILKKKFELNFGFHLDPDVFQTSKTKFGHSDYPELVVHLSIFTNKDNLEDKRHEYCKRIADNSEEWEYIPDVNTPMILASHTSMLDFISNSDDQIEEIQKWFAKRLKFLQNYIKEHKL